MIKFKKTSCFVFCCCCCLRIFLFQRLKRNASTSEVVGERTLGEKMKNISREAKLFKCYTNHSIRATDVTILDKSGFEARHRAVAKLQNKTRQVSSAGKREPLEVSGGIPPSSVCSNALLSIFRGIFSSEKSISSKCRSSLFYCWAILVPS